ncbi:TniB family NTP-binding protein [Leptolyngbya ohadii]|uniref:TniB family NTP-binding protein n=1 Tax=Leptolyngbya ohadii TaxID=1962290 RepID=UPI000B5A1B35|nr:TniB family NTP-binding protein [Leptolyngbya ohadii]
MTLEGREQITLPARLIEPGAQESIARLQRQCFVELGTVQQFHAWLDDKRQCRQACRVIGDSRTGKTIACDAYRLKYASQTASGDAPIVPVIYWHATTETGQRELFVGLLEHLKYRITNGTISDLRERVYRLLRSCQVEMIILDEAHRFRPKTFSEIRDIFDLLGIAVVLVGTDRLDVVVRRDEQVHNRFMACHRFHRFDSQALEDTTAIWEEYVLRLPQPSDLTSATMQKILAATTRGYLGTLDEILRNAARRALESGQSRIEASLLNQVALEYK